MLQKRSLYIIFSVTLLVIIGVLLYRHSMVDIATELELFEVMNQECKSLNVTSIEQEFKHALVSLAKGTTYTIKGAFVKTTLHIIPQTTKGKADVSKIITIKFGNWQFINDITKVEISMLEDKQINVTAHNTSTHASLKQTLETTNVCLYHYIPSTAKPEDVLKIAKT